MSTGGESGPGRAIGIFTKMQMVGGSEIRAVELANGIATVAGCTSYLLVEQGMPPRLRATLSDQVTLIPEVGSAAGLAQLPMLDALLVINSDSRRFTTREYWAGEAEETCRLALLRQSRVAAFLFNFIVSPACQLPSLSGECADLRIITANQKFFAEISEQARYEGVRHYPRLRLESPIASASAQAKTASARVRLGMHSLPNGSKWNREWPHLIEQVNSLCQDEILWDFMGMPKALQAEIAADNVLLRPEFSVPVPEFLSGLDVFVFFLDWKREEAWARSAGEALMSGCPVITTTKGGNQDQVVHGNTGFLCGTLDEFVEACRRLVADAHLRSALSANARTAARAFSTERVVAKLLEFLR